MSPNLLNGLMIRLKPFQGLDKLLSYKMFILTNDEQMDTNELNQDSLPIIGRVATVDLVDWNIRAIEAKIDTGAYTSSIHCHHIEAIGDSKVRFKLFDPNYPQYENTFIKQPIYKEKSVRSSNGKSEKRYIIKTTLVLAQKSFNAQFSLTDRSTMRYPLLIGRRLLNGNFMVDVSKKPE